MTFPFRGRASPKAAVCRVPKLSASILSPLLLTGVAAAFAAHAQVASTPRPIIEEQRQQERERALREQQERTVDTRLKPAVIDAQTLPEDERPCFRIDRLVLSGELADDFQWALDAAARSGEAADDWQGRCLGTAGVNVSVANALAHAIAGCAVGAARTGGSCTAGALGAAVGELAASLYDPGALNTQGDTVQFAAMMGSIAGAIAGLDAAEINQASQAGANSAANNWLATKQVEQAKKELAEAKSPLEALQVAAKWAAVGVKQDVLTTSGIGLGLAESGISDIKGLGEFLAHPIDGLSGIKQLISNPEARAQMGDSVFRELDAKIDRIQTSLTNGGDQNAVQLGQDLGSLIWQVGTVVTGAGAAAKGGVALVNAAASLGTKALESAALQFMKLDAGTIKGFRSADEINAMMKTTADWSPAWKPGTTVAETTIKPGTRIQMVVDETTYMNYINSGKTSIRYGGWGTFDDVPNQAYARNQLALTESMKENVGYVVELEVTKPINAQVGVVGPQGSATGGGNQLHFVIPPGDRATIFKVVGERKLM